MSEMHSGLYVVGRSPHLHPKEARTVRLKFDDGFAVEIQQMGAEELRAAWHESWSRPSEILHKRISEHYLPMAHHIADFWSRKIRGRAPWQMAEMFSTAWEILSKCVVGFVPCGCSFESYSWRPIEGAVKKRFRPKAEVFNDAALFIHDCFWSHGDEPPELSIIDHRKSDVDYIEELDTRSRVLSVLTYRQREIVKMRYWEGWANSDTARVFKITRSRVQQILEMAERRLKHDWVRSRLLDVIRDANQPA